MTPVGCSDVVPAELQSARPAVLEVLELGHYLAGLFLTCNYKCHKYIHCHCSQEYVRGRLATFVDLLTQRLKNAEPAVPEDVIAKAANEALQAMPAAEYGPTPLETRDLQLVFRHDCL